MDLGEGVMDVMSPRSNRAGVARRQHAPDHQHDQRADHGADQAGAFIGLVPAELLAEVSRDEGAGDAEQASSR